MTAVVRIRAFLDFALASARMARRLRGDLIFATSTPLTIFIPAWYAGVGRNSPIVFEIRDSWPTVPIALGYLPNPIAQRLARALERFAYRRSEHIVALSPGMKQDACEHGADADRVSVIPNAADVALFAVEPSTGDAWRSSNDISLDTPLLVYAGTFGAANEVEYLVDLAKEVVCIEPSVTFALIGTGGREEAVRNRAASHGLLGNTIRILPPVPKRLMPAVLSAADVTASVVTDNPAMNANSANKFFDSLAAGRAIVINHEGWQAELIRESSIGLVLDRQDLRAAARHLTSLLLDKGTLAAMGARARDLAEKQFSRDDLAKKLAHTLEALHQKEY